MDAYLTIADIYLAMRLDANPKCLNVKTRMDSSKKLFGNKMFGFHY
jgi:hypothetical protein